MNETVRVIRPRAGGWRGLYSPKGLIAAGLTAASLFYLARSARLPSLGDAASHAGYDLLALAFCLILLVNVCKGARWRALYPSRERPGLGVAVAAIAAGQIANWAMPVRLGEVVRLGFVSSGSGQARGMSQGMALGVGVLAVEKLLDGLMLVLAVVLLAVLAGLPGWVSTMGLLLIVFFCTGGIALVFILRNPPEDGSVLARLGRRVWASLPGHVSQLEPYFESVRDGLQVWLNPGTAALVFLLSAVAWGLGVLVNYVVLAGLGMEEGLGAALAVLVVLYGGALVPSLPGRIGIFQYLCVLALTPFGVDFDRALAYSIALYAVVFLPTIALGLASFVLMGSSPAPGGMKKASTAVPSEPETEEAGAVQPAIRYSVIVPAYNAAKTIDACLQALLNQSLPRDVYEIIVVDDGSTDDTAMLAGRYPVRLLRQSHAGPASARNRGATEAVGEFLLFTDADCTPTHSWIEEIVRPLAENSEVAAAKGVYRSCQTGLIARLAQVEFEEKYAGLRRRRNIDFIDTYSAAFRRDAFWEGGAFDPVFPAASNEDTQLSFNLAAQGRRIVFAGNAVVYHHHTESLRRYLWRKWRHGFWRVRVYRRHPGKMAGDSYTPRSTQLQFLSVALLGLALPFADLRIYALAAGALFVMATLPFVRRAHSAGWDVAVAVPFVLFLRALALGIGLVAGAIMLPFTTRTKAKLYSAARDLHR